MKFRIHTNDPGCAEHFSSIVQMVGGLAKNAILRLNKNHISFILKERAMYGGITACCEIEHSNLFPNRVCEGLSHEHDEIFLEVTIDHLLHCIRLNNNSSSNSNTFYNSTSYSSNTTTNKSYSTNRSHNTSHHVQTTLTNTNSLLGLKIKLVRRKTPCLAIELEESSYTGRSRSVWHFIPVQIVPLRLWDEFIELPDPDFDVSIFFPQIKTLRPFVDHMKKFAKFIIISANGLGELNLGINVETLVFVKVTFKGLKAKNWMPSESMHAEQNLDQDPVDTVSTDYNKSFHLSDGLRLNKKIKEAGSDGRFVSVSLDIRRFAQLLASVRQSLSCFVCNIVHEQLAQFVLLFDNCKLKYNVPASNL